MLALLQAVTPRRLIGVDATVLETNPRHHVDSLRSIQAMKVECTIHSWIRRGVIGRSIPIERLRTVAKMAESVVDVNGVCVA